MMQFRALRPEEVECRVGQVKKDGSGLSLLLYKDARCDMRILDETVGPLNWQRHHDLINGNLFCTVSIWDEDKKQWIEKQDVGTESNTEKEKGEASDSFKRACFNVGIGRELYTAPFIWIDGKHCNIVEQNGKKVTYDKFSVDLMEVEDGRITKLAIRREYKDRDGWKRDVAFTYPRDLGQQKQVNVTQKPQNDVRQAKPVEQDKVVALDEKEAENAVSEAQVKAIQTMAKAKGVEAQSFVYRLTNKRSIDQLTGLDARLVIKELNAIKR